MATPTRRAGPATTMTAGTETAILAEGLRKRYGKVSALNGFDLTVVSGSVCGVLGPNGAGKTTAIRVLTTLTLPDGGSARVRGHDVVREAAHVRRAIGVAGQYATLDERITGRENLWIFGRLHHLGSAAARRRADELLERFELTEAADRLVSGYSGGMRRRLDLCASLISAPPILFLDEPTTGLDPHSRNQIWRGIRELSRGGTTVLLTTQYLEEADQLADDIAVVDAGRVIASGSPDVLKSGLGRHIEVIPAPDTDLAAARDVLAALTGSEPRTLETQGTDERRLTATVTEPSLTLPRVVHELDAAGVTVEDVALRRPTLDDVFLRLTGHGVEPGTAVEPNLGGTR